MEINENDASYALIIMIFIRIFLFIKDEKKKY